MDNCYLYEFSKNSNEVVRAGLSEFKGKHYISLRIFFKAGNND